METKTWVLIFAIFYIVLGMITAFGMYMDNKSSYNQKMKVAYGFILAFLCIACIATTTYSFLCGRSSAEIVYQ